MNLARMDARDAGVSSQLLDDKVSFQALCPELDKRLLKAVAKLGFVYPTLVQVRG